MKTANYQTIFSDGSRSKALSAATLRTQRRNIAAEIRELRGKLRANPGSPGAASRREQIQLNRTHAKQNLRPIGRG